MRECSDALSILKSPSFESYHVHAASVATLPGSLGRMVFKPLTSAWVETSILGLRKECFT